MYNRQSPVQFNLTMNTLTVTFNTYYIYVGSNNRLFIALTYK